MQSELLEWVACFNEQNVCKAFDKYNVKNEIKGKNGKETAVYKLQLSSVWSITSSVGAFFMPHIEC